MSMRLRAHYNKVLEILSSYMKEQSEYNALIKIKINTEDLKLESMIIYYLETFKFRSYTKTESDLRIESFKLLKDYCQKMKDSKKPEWQVIAERERWSNKND